MTKPNNKRGFRTITVENTLFNWRFSGIVDIRPDEHQGNILTVDFGWYDPTLYLSDPENTPPTFTPKIVTPKFVSKSIKFAIKHGWNTALTNNNTKLLYKQGVYHLINNK